MAEGKIIRKGGAVTAQALAPTITEVSTTDSSITFTITNNDASTAVILWEVGDTTPDANSVELAAGATSSNLTVTGLDDDETYIVYATANVTGKVKSNVASASIDTNPSIVYTAATGGTTAEYDSGGKRYKSHTFTSNGTFEVTTVGDAIDDRNKVDYLIIAGGAGGASGIYTGGGGAGGYRTSVGTSGANSSAESKVTISATSYTVTIGGGGAGGAAASTSGNPGSNGNNSSITFPTTITSTAGGGGAQFLSNGSNGGSGGGAGGDGSGGGSLIQTAGTGTSAQGFAGGRGFSRSSNLGAGGGGGGASQVGANGASGIGGNGGNGLANLLRTGSNETRAGGGGGAVQDSGATVGSGGSGGGGSGGKINTAPTNATANTGSGGGGAGGGNIEAFAGGNGAGGILIVRYEIAPSV